MNPATIELIVKGITLSADLLSNGVKAYEANAAAFSSDDAALINQAIASVSALNAGRETVALEALDAAAKT